MYETREGKSCSVVLGGTRQPGSKQMNDIVTKESGFQQEIDREGFICLDNSYAQLSRN